MGTMTYTGTLVILGCGSCHVRFAVPSDFDRRGRQYNLNVWCPCCGHGMCYGEEEVAKLRAALAREEGRSASFRADAEKAEARRRAEKAAKTKLKKRIAGGVCPCCKRTFQNLQRHMAGQHPGFPGSRSRTRAT